MIDQANFLLMLVLAIVTTAVITALLIRPEWFGLGDDNPEGNDERHE